MEKPKRLQEMDIPRLDSLSTDILGRVVRIGSEHPEWSVKKCTWRAIERDRVMHCGRILPGQRGDAR